MSLTNATSAWGKNATNFLNDLVGGNKKGGVLLPKSMGGFVFSVLEETTLDLKSTITTHYIEDGSNVQQNISNQPKIIKLKGFMLELELDDNKLIKSLGNVLNSIDKKVSVVDNLLGNHVSPSMKRIYNNARITTTEYLNKAEQITKGANNFLSVFMNTSKGESKIDQAYTKLETLWKNKTTFSVQTFRKTSYENMAILSLSIKQTGNMQNSIDVMVDLQEIKTVESKKKKLSKGKAATIERLSKVTNNTNVVKQ